MTRLDWNGVLELPAMDFLNYIAFYNFKKHKENKALEKFRKQIN